MTCYHSINNIKGAAIIRGPQARQMRQQQTITFPQTEINLVNNSLNILKFYITRNPQVFQQSEDMLQKVNSAINIISSKQLPQSVKGASSTNSKNNICYKKEHLKELLNMFHL